jgi:miniconductance mechanosensitive channel
MLEQFKKYAIIKDYILKKEKEIKESNSTIINDESNQLILKTTNIGF